MLQSPQCFRQRWGCRKMGVHPTVAHCNPAKFSFILSASCLILNRVQSSCLQGGECLVHVIARGLAGFNTQPVSGSVGPSAWPHFVLTLFKTCVFCLLRPVGPCTWEQRTKQTLVWMWVFFHLHKHTATSVCVLTSHPSRSSCPTLPANLHLLKNITTVAHDPLLQRGWESKHHVRSSVCTVWCSSEQKDSHQKTLYCPEGQVDNSNWPSWAGRDLTSRWDVKQWAKVAVPLSGIAFIFQNVWWQQNSGQGE